MTNCRLMNKNLINPLSTENPSTGVGKHSYLILHNDDVNTFDYVINCLIEICDHDYVQAEQCAMITHYKGKCDIKKGEMKSLKKMEKMLSQKGLIASIE